MSSLFSFQTGQQVGEFPGDGCLFVGFGRRPGFHYCEALAAEVAEAVGQPMNGQTAVAGRASDQVMLTGCAPRQQWREQRALAI